MTALYPTALDTGTSLANTRVINDNIPASDHNDLATALIAAETKIGIGTGAPTSSGQVFTATAPGVTTWSNPAYSGTVTSATIVSANGLAGTIATATTTPAITLSTSVTGVLKGNGTAISAATAGTDYTTPTGTETLTNKRVTTRTAAITSSGTPAINTDTTDEFDITAQAVAITSMTTSLTGTPTNGQRLFIRIKDNATAQTIAWGTSFVSSGAATLLATTVISKTHYIGLRYDSTAAKWVCLAVDAVGY